MPALSQLMAISLRLGRCIEKARGPRQGFGRPTGTARMVQRVRVVQSRLVPWELEQQLGAVVPAQRWDRDCCWEQF